MVLGSKFGGACVPLWEGVAFVKAQRQVSVEQTSSMGPLHNLVYTSRCSCAVGSVAASESFTMRSNHLHRTWLHETSKSSAKCGMTHII